MEGVTASRVKAQPRTRSRRTFSARARSDAYSSSGMVPAWWRGSRRKSWSFKYSRLVATAALTFSIDGAEGLACEETAEFFVELDRESDVANGSAEFSTGATVTAI